MFFTKVDLENYRNYEKESVCFHPNVNIITGNNAQGKTNLIEGLYLMGLGKSFRTGRDLELIKFGNDYCKVKALYIKDNQEHQLEVIITKEGKSIIADGIRLRKISELLEHVFIVVFSPEDLKIVKDEPEKRRRFIDRELCQLKPLYYSNLVNYKKALIQRNSLLKQDNIDKSLLEVWDSSLIEYGCKLMDERNIFINKLDKISKELHGKITNGKEKLELKYEANISTMLKSDYFNKIKKNHGIDIKRGTTSAGPHKDDFKICINGVDIRHFGSQGQQRTAALSLKLAEVYLIKDEKDENPILLLDDVLSELDEERQKFLIDTLSQVQMFITTTELSDVILKSSELGKTFMISGGRVEKQLSIT